MKMRERMHWIERWRIIHRMNRKKLAALADCSPGLIAILEEDAHGVTHPRIAARIARVTGASDEQWDSIVAKCRRGKRKRYESLMGALRAKPEEERRKPLNKSNPGKEVVMFDRNGAELARFPSTGAAAKPLMCTANLVQVRCWGKLGKKTDEFLPYECTFRYAEDWDKLSPDERRALAQRAMGCRG